MSSAVSKSFLPYIFHCNKKKDQRRSGTAVVIHEEHLKKVIFKKVGGKCKAILLVVKGKLPLRLKKAVIVYEKQWP